tara:strand:+ start:123 stop:245 length:123 start_codon:yes stop_codon:yes gene_type:complete
MALAQERTANWNSIKAKTDKRIKTPDVLFRKKLFTKEYFD